MSTGYGSDKFGFEGKFCEFHNGAIGIYLQDKRALILKDKNHKLTCELIHGSSPDWAEPWRVAAPFTMFKNDPGTVSLNQHVIVSDIFRLIRAGEKYYQIRKLLEDD